MELRSRLVNSVRLLPDLLWVQVCLALSVFFAHNEQWLIPIATYAEIKALPILAVSFLLFAWRGVHRIRARYIGMYDMINVGFAVILLTLAQATAQIAWEREISLAAPLLFGFMTFAGMAGSRVVARWWSWNREALGTRDEDRRSVRTLIVGAGDAGEFVLREIRRGLLGRRHVVGFVDDEPKKSSLILQGVRVLGRSEDIPRLVTQFRVDEIIICIPSSTGDTMRRINDLCMSTEVRVRTLPSVSQLLHGPVNIGRMLRDVSVEDLLRRPPAQVDEGLIARLVTGESVLVTGGGGSIGSEMARQVARLKPARLTLLGKGENSLYEIEQELLQSTDLLPSMVVADVRDERSMEYAFTKNKPTLVFHAAAHKHVPLMQSNPIEAIRNNVFGTLCAVETSVRHGVKRFVLVSTDKAVNPTSVMGATKRVAEMIVNAHAHRSETNFAVVRFGNVLGSRGSLIPLLKRQIAAGGPVRITHPDMTRFFMTIPEAVQLVLQAGSKGENGELFILDMGEPVRILDLAHDLIRLHGLVPHQDIEVKFIGPRPGEKLYEELTYPKEALIPTDHPRINMARTTPVDWSWLRRELLQLQAMCDAGDQAGAQQFLMELAWGKHDLQEHTWDDLQHVA